jgi:cobalt-zinc-cadmium resistance protein CzcA
MFHPMALTVMLALGGALVLALTLMPALCSFFLMGRIAERDNAVVRLIKSLYSPLLHWSLRIRWLVVLGAIALFALAMVIFRNLGADFIPKLDEGTFTMMVFRRSNINIEQSIEEQRKTEQEIRRRVPEVTHVFSRIGSAEIATDPMPPSDCDFYVYYKPQSEWRKIDNKPMTKEELAKIITRELQTLNPGARVMVAQPVEMRFNEMLEGIRADIAVKIFGNDYDVLERLGDQVKEVLEQIPGTREGEGEVEYETTGRAPMLEIRVKRDVLAKYNLHAGDINQTIGAALGGETVGTMIEQNRRFDIVVRLAEADRESLETIRALPVRVGDFGLLPLGDLADIERVKTVSPILRDSAQRRAALMVNLGGRDVESWVREADAKVHEQVKLPEGYTIEFGGQFENLREAKTRLAIVVPAALVFIFVLIFIAFASVRQALLVYSGVPLAVTGGVFALWLRDMPFSISAAVGFIALSGVAVLNGVVMISYFNQLREEGRDVRTAVIEGSLTRLRPVLMTAAVAAFGFIPMALSTSAGAEVQRPLATVVIGGIVSSTFLTLVLLPVLYDSIERKTKQAMQKS